MPPIEAIQPALIAAFGALMVIAAISDLRSLRIPNALCLLVAALYVPFAMTGGAAGPWWSAPAAGFAVFAAGTVCFAKGWMGGGDVKLAAATALWAGTPLILEFLAVSAIAGGFLALVFLSPFRFGVALTLSDAGLHAEGQAVAGGQLPYGMALAAGGLFLACKLAGL